MGSSRPKHVLPITEENFELPFLHRGPNSKQTDSIVPVSFVLWTVNSLVQWRRPLFEWLQERGTALQWNFPQSFPHKFSPVVYQTVVLLILRPFTFFCFYLFTWTVIPRLNQQKKNGFFVWDIWEAGVRSRCESMGVADQLSQCDWHVS